MAKTSTDVSLREKIIASFNRHSGNVSAVSREIGCSRSSVRRNIAKVGIGKKPLAGGKKKAKAQRHSLPEAGEIKRYILTSAQNNTHVHKEFWENLQAMAEHYHAKILVGTFSYNQNNYGKLAVKKGTKKPYENTLWFDPAFAQYISDERIELAPGLLWAGNMNILPTEDNPISGLETYGGSTSVVFPHTKIEMRSIATTPDMPVKMIYTTGTVTQMNYLQKKLGIKAEHHHRYAFLLVEVDSQGNWWVRQVAARKNGHNIQDLNVVAEGGKIISTDAAIEAVTWGDLHSTNVQPEVVEASLNMLDELRPKYQFLHDILEGVSINRHYVKHAPLPHLYFHRWLRGLHRVEEELSRSKEVVERYLRPWCKTVVADSNHDGYWLESWLNKYDYRYDPANAELFLRLQTYMYEQIRAGSVPKNVNLIQRVMEVEAGIKPGAIKFLLPDESFEIREVECGMHGHLGPDGAFGSPSNLAKIGKKATTAHTHSCGIYHGLYVAGTSSKLTRDWDYTVGPSSWSHSHVVLYPNGQRAIVTMKGGKWKA
ncbi:MAG: hypothetical protein C5B59_08565 [Bacteroidetes bacterium]|nr:MAG: hypothetical protein C5B59_08565 [Bacteroidota bacterium]